MVEPRAPLDPVEQIRADIRKLYEMVHELGRANPLESAAIERGGLVIGGGGAVRSRDFDGTGPAEPGTTGWWLGGEDAGAVFNQIALRDGIIGNDALTEPVTAAVATDSVSNISLTTTSTAKATTSIAVPSGFTRALVQVACDGSIRNANTAFDYIYMAARIGSTTGQERINLIGANGGYAYIGATLALLVTGLGSSLTISAMMRSGFNTIPADATSGATVSGTAIFLR